jgi:hypothetical protein
MAHASSKARGKPSALTPASAVSPPPSRSLISAIAPYEKDFLLQELIFKHLSASHAVHCSIYGLVQRLHQLTIIPQHLIRIIEPIHHLIKPYTSEMATATHTAPLMISSRRVVNYSITNGFDHPHSADGTGLAWLIVPEHLRSAATINVKSPPTEVKLYVPWTVKLIALIQAIASYEGCWSLAESELCVEHKPQCDRPVLPPSLYNLLEVLSPVSIQTPTFKAVNGLAVACGDFFNLRFIRILSLQPKPPTSATLLHEIPPSNFQFFLILYIISCLEESGEKWGTKEWFFNMILLHLAMICAPVNTVAPNVLYNFGLPAEEFTEILALSGAFSPDVRKTLKYVCDKGVKTIRTLLDTKPTERTKTLLQFASSIPLLQTKHFLDALPHCQIVLQPIRLLEWLSLKRRLFSAFAFTTVSQILSFVRAKVSQAAWAPKSEIYAVIPGALAAVIYPLFKRFFDRPLCLDVMLPDVCTTHTSTVLVGSDAHLRSLYESHLCTALKNAMGVQPIDPNGRAACNIYRSNFHLGAVLCSMLHRANKSETDGRLVCDVALQALYRYTRANSSEADIPILSTDILLLALQKVGVTEQVRANRTIQQSAILSILFWFRPMAIHKNVLNSLRANYMNDVPESKALNLPEVDPKELFDGPKLASVLFSIQPPNSHVTTDSIRAAPNHHQGYVVLTDPQKSSIFNFLATASNGLPKSKAYSLLWWELVSRILPVFCGSTEAKCESLKSRIVPTPLEPSDLPAYHGWTYPLPWSSDPQPLVPNAAWNLEFYMRVFMTAFAGWSLYEAESPTAETVSSVSPVLSAMLRCERLPRYMKDDRDGKEVFLPRCHLYNEIVAPVLNSVFLTQTATHAQSKMMDTTTCYNHVMNIFREHQATLAVIPILPIAAVLSPALSGEPSPTAHRKGVKRASAELRPLNGGEAETDSDPSSESD